MNKCALLVFSMAVVAIAAGCSKDETTSRDADLAGVNVAVGEKNGPFKKLFVLNEGNFQKNNSTLDFFRFSDGNYVSDAFGSMNPAVVQGLGDTGNDLCLFAGRLWAAMNASGVIQVMDANDETLLASIPVPDPRYLAFSGLNVFVSSYAGAVYGGEETKGKVYRISLDTFKTDAEVEVGCQPEGLAVSAGTLFVANSGGYNYVHDNTVSVIDLKSFTGTRTGLWPPTSALWWLTTTEAYGSQAMEKAPGPRMPEATGSRACPSRWAFTMSRLHLQCNRPRMSM